MNHFKRCRQDPSWEIVCILSINSQSYKSLQQLDDKHKAAPDSKVHGANMGPTWVLSAPYGPHVGPMNLAIREPFPAVARCNKWANTDIGIVWFISMHWHVLCLNVRWSTACTYDVYHKICSWFCSALLYCGCIISFLSDLITYHQELMRPRNSHVALGSLSTLDRWKWLYITSSSWPQGTLSPWGPQGARTVWWVPHDTWYFLVQPLVCPSAPPMIVANQGPLAEIVLPSKFSG